VRHCAFCNNPLSRWAEWKSDDGLFYCSEFCADAGPDIVASRVRELAVAAGGQLSNDSNPRTRLSPRSR
jgi:hypothetical protein